MHPEDVAELVVAEVAELERKLADRPDLRVSGVALEDGVEVFLAYEVDLRKPWTMVDRRTGKQVPTLGPRHTENRVLHLNCWNWNGRAPLANLLLPDRTPLPPQLWPMEIGGQGIVHGHRDYRRPFFCRPGTQEFHSHTQHADEPWDRHRPTRTLDQIVIDLLGDLQTRFIGGL